MRSLYALSATIASFILSATVLAEANPALDGYADHAEFLRQLTALDASEAVAVTSLGKSLNGRDIALITVGEGQLHEKPAIVILGNVEAAYPTGGEITLRVARAMASLAQNDPQFKALLGRCTFYLIPRPDPDGAEKCFVRPWREPAGNGRQTDDDQDFTLGEDPPDDLNGDGWITQMRILDEVGTHLPHPDDPRILIPIDRKKNELGQYRLLTEGRDNDGDGEFNEDAGDGVAFNRNFPFRYAPFQKQAGANAASEPEVRAVIDFLYERPNVAAVFCFSLEDNLYFPWKPRPDADKGRKRGSVQEADIPAFQFLAEQYRQTHGGKEPPEPRVGHGSLAEWAYFHYGRWSLAGPGWWLPQVVAKEGEPKPRDDKRGAEDLNALRRFAQEKIDGFVDWQPIEHPDFPGRKVEVGGFKPFYRLNPPAKELDALAAKQLAYLQQLAGWLPRLTIRDAKAEALGGGIVRLTATALNQGYLATMPEMGRITGEAYPLQMAVDVPKATELLQGPLRMRVKRLEGLGGQEEKVWLLRFPGETPSSIKVRLWGPPAGSVETTVEVK